MVSKTSNARDNYSSNALHVAVALNLLNFIREIIDGRPELALSFDEHGLTPFHLAVAYGHISAMKELLDSKVGNDICRLRDKGGFLPIHAAVIKGSVDIIKVMIDSCCMAMLRELTGQGDNILHLALKFDSIEAFNYLWYILSGDKKLLNNGDAEGNTLLHLAVMRRQQEIIKILVGKVDLGAKNIKGSTALDILSEFGYSQEEMILLGHEVSQLETTRQSNPIQSGESRIHSFSLAAGIEIFSYPRKRLFDFRRSLSREMSSDTDREMSNVLMVVATLIAAITFQSALNPPGGFIQYGEDKGMAVLEDMLGWYLLFDIMGFISSMSVILLTIYVVPKWKDTLKVAMFIIWLSVFFTFTSFYYAIAIIFDHVSNHPLIVGAINFGNGIVLVFAFSMFIYSWYFFHRNMRTSLLARSTKEISVRPKIIVVNCLAFLVAALLWLPIVMFSIIRYYMM